MNKRPRMSELANVLLESEAQAPERAEKTAPEEVQQTGNKKTANLKTRKKVFGKIAERQIGPRGGEPLEVNRPYGQRGDFDKVTVTLPREFRMMLVDESVRRKKEGSRDWPIAAILREAIGSYLGAKS